LDSFLYVDPKYLFDNNSVINITHIQETLIVHRRYMPEKFANGQTMMHKF